MAASISDNQMLLRIRTAAVSRADLLRLVLTVGKEAAKDLAPLCRFEFEAKSPNARLTRQPVVSNLDRQAPADIFTAPTSGPLRATVVAVVRSSTAQDVAAYSPDNTDGDVFEHQFACESHQVPTSLRLVPANRMATYLRRALRQPGPSGLIDVESWVRQVALAKPLSCLPTRKVRGWNHGSALVMDGGPSMSAYQGDLAELALETLRWSGGRTAVYWRSEAGKWWRAESATGAGLRWLPAQQGDCQNARHWLWVGSSSEGTSPTATTTDWPQMVRRVLARNGTVHWLRPQHAGAPATGWPLAVRVASWDHGASLHDLRVPSAAVALASRVRDRLDNELQLLVAALSLTVRAERPLLRAMRVLLNLAIDVEQSIWSHSDVKQNGLCCWVGPMHVAHYREKLRTSRITADQRAALANLVREYNGHLSPLIQAEDAAVAADLARGSQMTPSIAKPAHEFWTKAARTLRLAPGSPIATDIASYVRRTARRAHPDVWQFNPGLAETWVRAEESAVRRGGPLPNGMPINIVGRVLGPGFLQDTDPRIWELCQIGQTLRLGTPGQAHVQRLLRSFVEIGESAGAIVTENGVDRWVDVGNSGADLAQLEGPGPWVLRTLMMEIEIAAIERPPWAYEWGYDERGPYALTPFLAGHQARFDVPTDRPVNPQQPWFAEGQTWVGAQAISPAGEIDFEQKIAFGIDVEFGLYADVTVNGVVQRFRWIEPGSFKMGSPEGEVDRSDDEGPQHEVRLTKGFWLADTACTQAMWEAVMGNNPSHFKGDPQRPVECVNWLHVQHFLRKLNALVPGCEAGLPTEAQWEYACRAGTLTPFSFGELITPKQVNCNGKYKYVGAVKGLFREQTVAVKSLPANDWGLYEMHGNVWEWCADGKRHYDGVEQCDPVGPLGSRSEGHRVVRGGSWLNVAKSARSAYRGDDHPGYVFQYLGFRLCLRSQERGSGRAVSEWLSGRDGPMASAGRRRAGTTSKSVSTGSRIKRKLSSLDIDVDPSSPNKRKH